MKLELPTIQNWSCHNCSGCCRQHAIEVTSEERKRIEEQHWSSEDGITEGTRLMVPFGPFWNRRYRLAHRDDGSCLFLNDEGLCKIHAKFGEAAKPLPCRIYPYAFHPDGKKVTVSLRFSCPSVVANAGKPLHEQSRDIHEIANQVVPEKTIEIPPPRLSAGESVDWKDFHRFVRHLDQTFADDSTPFPVKLLQAVFWVNLVGQAKFDNIRGQQLEEFLDLITTAAKSEIVERTDEIDPPTKLGLSQFRLLVAQYSRKDSFVEGIGSLRNRLRRLKIYWQFAFAQGLLPEMREGLAAFPFDDIEKPFNQMPSKAHEILSRYFRVKIQGLHFCGPAYYNVPFVEGFQSLALIVPAICWLARWHAVSDHRSSLVTEDIAQAIAFADHHHGYSPPFGGRSFRRRVRILSKTGDLQKLIQRYVC